jgi:hypothetical protein
MEMGVTSALSVPPTIQALFPLQAPCVKPTGTGEKMNGKRLGIEVVLSVIYWVFASRFFHITEIELKIKDYDIFGTLQ